jgi:hypothetical protein
VTAHRYRPTPRQEVAFLLMLPVYVIAVIPAIVLAWLLIAAATAADTIIELIGRRRRCASS